MQPLPSLRLMLCFVFLGCGLVLWNLDSLWSQSVDLAHHYALIVRISEHHSFAVEDLTLGEMNFYPRLSHVIAAVVATIVGSNLLGLQIVTLLSVSLLWGSYIYILKGLPRQWASASIVVLAFLLILNKYLLKFEVHGFEIVSNFFFSQLVAQAFVICGLVFAIRLEVKDKKLTVYLLLSAMVFVTTSTHLLPALELLVVLLGLLAFDLFFALTKRKAFISTFLVFSVFSILGLCAVFLNPAFSIMRKISENNGALDFRYISFPLGLGSVCLIAIALSVGFLCYYYRHLNRNLVALKYVAFYGLSQAGLCLLQLMLTKYGVGSDYAVKKYGFGLISYIFVSLAIIAGALLVPWLNRYFWSRATSVGIVGSVCVLICYWVVVVSVLPKEKSLDVFELVGVERNLKNLVTSDLPLAHSGQSNVIVGIKSLSPQFNYMFSIALARTVRDLAIPDVLLDGISDYERYSYIVSQSGSPKYDVKDCEVRAVNGFSIVRGDCMAEHAKKALTCAGKFDFSQNGSVNPSMIKGFSHAEAEGRWMDGGKSSVVCDVLVQAPTNARIVLTPFFAGDLQQQRLEVVVNGVVVDKSIYAKGHSGGELNVALPPIESNRKYEVSFITPDGTSPKAIGLSDDPRVLSFFLRSIEFY